MEIVIASSLQHSVSETVTRADLSHDLYLRSIAGDFIRSTLSCYSLTLFQFLDPCLHILSNVAFDRIPMRKAMVKSYKNHTLTQTNYLINPINVRASLETTRDLYHCISLIWRVNRCQKPAASQILPFSLYFIYIKAVCQKFVHSIVSV